MGNSFFKINRDLFQSDIWIDDEPYDRRSAWIYLIGMANYKQTRRFYKGSLQTTERGQLQTSVEKLAKAWKWSRGKVRRYLKALEQAEMVHTHGTPNGTTITIEKYAVYQDRRPTDGPADGTPDGSPDGSPDGTHKKNRKEGKKNSQEARARAGEPSADLWEDDEEDFGSYQSSDTSNLTDAEKKALLLAWEREAFKMREGNN